MTKQEFDDMSIKIARKIGVTAKDETVLSQMHKLFVIGDNGVVVPYNQFKPICIYVLRNPIDNSIFYVGRTAVSLPQRLRMHLATPKNGNKRKASVFKALSDLGVKPIIEKIEEFKPICEEEYIGLHEKEDFWINYFTQRGEPITNRKTNMASAIQPIQEQINSLK